MALLHKRVTQDYDREKKFLQEVVVKSNSKERANRKALKEAIALKERKRRGLQTAEEAEASAEKKGFAEISMALSEKGGSAFTRLMVPQKLNEIRKKV